MPEVDVGVGALVVVGVVVGAVFVGVVAGVLDVGAGVVGPPGLERVSIVIQSSPFPPSTYRH